MSWKPKNIKPYYEDDNIFLIHGDCNDYLDKFDNKFDLLLCDPPYGIGEGAKKNNGRINYANVRKYENIVWDDKICQNEINQSILLCKYSIIFGGNYYYLPPTSCYLVWDKNNGNADFADCEIAWTNLPQAIRMITYKWQGMLQQNMKHKEHRYHPTQKPAEVIKWCIINADKHQLNNIIFDPFAGSGTTGRACKDLNRKCIMIEREEVYCEISANRMCQEVFNFK